MSRFDRLRDARNEVQRAATERWEARSAERAQAKALIATRGPGAADSGERRDAFAKRVQGLNYLRAIVPRVDLPLGVERRLGPSLDFVGLAPSEQARKAGRPVARIVDTVSVNFEPRGFATGFLVAPDLLMTNWHVFPSRADAEGCGANFLYEENERGLSRGILFALEPGRFFVSDKDLDFAIVAVASRTDRGELLADLGQITLIEARPKILKGQPVNIIQYPEGGAKQYAISQNRLVDILEADGFLQYETDTLEGSSGAPAFSDQWELIALHHASIPARKNGKVLARGGGFWTKAMSDEAVDWIANEGTRVSAIVARLASTATSDAAQAAILKSLIASTADPVAEAVAAVAGRETIERITAGPQTIAIPAGLDITGGSMAGIQCTFTGPVTININQPAATTPAAQPSPAPAFEKSIRFDPDYDNRGGYNPAFLDEGGTIVVPTPEVAAARLPEILRGDDGEPLVLKYHHFELMMNRERRLQMWSAVNVDYSPDRKVEGERDSWGSDRWMPDPRIPAALQIFDADFYKPAGNIDRGHIVRREDNEWGDNDLEIEFANSDTFHWTNCTPQHEAFNQSTPGRNDKTYRGMEGIWGGFENHIQKSRKGDGTRACILAGPILAANDPDADFGKGAIQYPIRFFKVVCVVEGAENAKQLRVFAFILSQQDVVDRFGIERLGPGRFKRYQVPLTQIETEAGLEFDAVLHRADVMAGQQERVAKSAIDITGIDLIAA